jgi:hypothetical protein
MLITFSVVERVSERAGSESGFSVVQEAPPTPRANDGLQVSLWGGWTVNSISPVLWFLFRFCFVIWTKLELG